MAWVMLVVILLVMGALLGAAALGLMAWSIVRPPRMTVGKAAYLLKRVSPDDLGLAYESVTFMVDDRRTGRSLDLRSPDLRSLDLAAWWIPAPGASDATVILIHGYGDAKIGAIAWAPPWHALGVNVLAVDLRAHGESAGTVCTAGSRERHDLSQVIDQLRAQRPDATRTLILMGISLGGAVVAATALLRQEIDGVVMDSPVGDFAGGAGHLARATDLALPSLMPLAARLAGRVLGVDFDAVSALNTLPQLKVPCLLVQSDDDALVPEPVRKKLRTAVGADHTWDVPHCAHTHALLVDPSGYVEHLSALLERSRVRV